MWLQDYSTEDLPRVWRQGHSSNLASPMSSMFPANNTQKEPNISNISTSISTTTPKKISKSSIDWPTGSSKGPLWKEERCSSMPLTCNWQLLLAWDIWSEWLKLPWSKVCSWSWRAKWRSLFTSWNKFKVMTSRKWPLCHFKENDLFSKIIFIICDLQIQNGRKLTSKFLQIYHPDVHQCVSLQKSPINHREEDNERGQDQQKILSDLFYLRHNTFCSQPRTLHVL